MAWTSDQDPAAPTAERDFSKVWWLAVAFLFVALVAAVWYTTLEAAPHVTRARVKHVLIKCDWNDAADRARAQSTVEGIRERLLAGENFSKIAKDYSNDPTSSKRGGDLGWIGKGELEDTVDAYVWNAPIGKLSEVIQSGYGYHLVIVTGREISETDAYEFELRQRAYDRQQDTGSDESTAKP